MLRGESASARLLVESSWILAVRGGLALAFGGALIAWPHATLDRVILVFGAYAALDGLWAVGSAVRLWRGGLPAWPVALEGLVSVALAGVALGWPLVSRDVVHLIGAWGVLTGVLELVWAGRLAVERAFRWLLVTAGASSLFLAGIVLALPYAYGDAVVYALTAYAGVFGAATLAAAWQSRGGLPGERRGDRDAVGAPRAGDAGTRPASVSPEAARQGAARDTIGAKPGAATR